MRYLQGYGSIACPLSLIRGKRSARVQQATIEEQRQELQNQIRTLKNRVRKKFFFDRGFVFNLKYLVSSSCTNANS
jgi:hypothetical protein